MANLVSMSNEDIAVAVATEDMLSQLDPIEYFETWHTLHGGIYSRTIKLKEGEAIVGALIKIPTTLSISGNMKLYIGNKVEVIDGFKIIAAGKHRKQVMFAISETYVTMSFATKAISIEQAESEFTDESDRLVSRLKDSINHITIGEISCQE